METHGTPPCWKRPCSARLSFSPEGDFLVAAGLHVAWNLRCAGWSTGLSIVMGVPQNSPKSLVDFMEKYKSKMDDLGGTPILENLQIVNIRDFSGTLEWKSPTVYESRIDSTDCQLSMEKVIAIDLWTWLTHRRMSSSSYLSLARFNTLDH